MSEMRLRWVIQPINIMQIERESVAVKVKYSQTLGTSIYGSDSKESACNAGDPGLTPHLILFHSFLHQPSILPSTRVFSNERALSIRWPKYWSFSFSNELSNECSNEHSGLISFRIDCFVLVAVQDS